MELANYAELSNYELNEINGGNGVIGKVYYVGAATAAGAIEGAEICAILGPEGAVAGAIGLGLYSGLSCYIGGVIFDNLP
jgi:hypothetical protein